MDCVHWFSCINMAKGLYWLHENMYLHRDIRPENIIEDYDGMYLTDFNFSLNLNYTNIAEPVGSRYASRTCEYR